MSLLLLNGVPVLSATVIRPYRGAWLVDLELEGNTAPTGAARLTVVGNKGEVRLELVGTLVRSGVHHQHVTARVVAGAAAMAKDVAANEWKDVTARVVIAAAVAAVGERLAESIDQGVAKHVLKVWEVTRAPAARVVETVLERVPGAIWRMTASGAVWFGVNEWPELKLEHELIELNHVDRRMVIVSDDPTLSAGVTLDGRRIVHVEHTYSTGRARTVAWFQ